MTAYVGPGPLPTNIVSNNLLLYVNAASEFSYRPNSNQPVWEDLSRNNRHMTIGANTTFSTLYGGGLKRGASGNIATTPTLNLSGNYSISLWLKTVTGAGSGNDTLVSIGSHRIFHNTNGPIFYASMGGFEYNLVQTGNVNNTLLYLTVTYDNSIEYYRMYVNTTLQGTADGSTAGWGLTAAGNTPVTFGTNFQNLEIYSIKIYNSLLNSTQITQNYNATRSRFGV